MNRKLILFLQLFWIQFLICSCIRVPKADPSLNQADGNLTSFIKVQIQRPKPMSPTFFEQPWTFPLQFSSENITLPIVVNCQANALWINPDIKGAPFDCSKSKSCQSQKSEGFSWEQDQWRDTFWGPFVKEQVSIGGVTLPSLDIFVASSSTKTSAGYIHLPEYSGMLGLALRPTNSRVPMLYEYLQKEGLIEKQIVSINLHDDYEGELIFGGYPDNRGKAHFKFVPLQQNFRYDGGFLVDRIVIRYKDIGLNRMRTILDFGVPYLTIPWEALEGIEDDLTSQGLELPPSMTYSHPDGLRAVKCEASKILRDLKIDFGEFTLRIPASSYVTKGLTRDGEEDLTNEVCFLSLLPENQFDNRLILGQPFFKTYYTTFDAESQSVGFSRKRVSRPGFFHSINLTPSLIIIIGLVTIVLSGLCIWSWIKKMRKPYIAFSGEGRTLGEPAPVIAESLPYPEEFGEPVQSLPYQDGFQNSSYKI